MSSIFFFYFFLISTTSVSTANLSDSHPSKLQLPLGDPIENSPGSRTGSIITCNRVHIHGLSRLRHLKFYAHSLKIRVSGAQGDTLFRIQDVEICSHRNVSIGVGKCPSTKWEKLSNGSWVRSISPFESRILDIRSIPDPSRSIEISTEQEFMLHRTVFLVMGLVMMMTARALSKSEVFYYGSAMTIGIILVVLMVLFQCMRLLPTGRKSSFAIFVYSSIVGVATFLLSYLSGLLQSILVEIGISEDMHNPLGIFLLVCLGLAGAWFGYWGVRKLVLMDDGSVDSGVAYFVEWSILIFSAVMILQSSLDTLLSGEALVLAILMSAVALISGKSRFLHHVIKYLSTWFIMDVAPTIPFEGLAYLITGKIKAGVSFRLLGMLRLCRLRKVKQFLTRKMWKGMCITQDQISPTRYQYGNLDFVQPRARARHSRSTPCNSPIQGLVKTPQVPSEKDSYYSTFHHTPQRKKFSKEEWEIFTKENTKQALKELVSSPAFHKWAIDNAEGITLTPSDAANCLKKQRLFRWF